MPQEKQETPNPENTTDGYYNAYWHDCSKWFPINAPLHPMEQILFQRYIAPGMTCIDYGCGDGSRYGRLLAEQNIIYRGFDISSIAVEKGRSLGLSLERLTETGIISMPDFSCDIAVCFEVLEHLMNPELALQEIRRVLKPGGVALLSVPNSSNWIQRMEFLFTGFFNPGGSPLTARNEPWRDAHIRFFSPTLFVKMAKQSGFVNIELQGTLFSFADLPYLYKKTHMHRLLNILSWPMAWLGPVFPSLFATRLFVVATSQSKAC